MRPNLETNIYDLDGQWDLLGEHTETLLPEYLDIRGDVQLVPGGGVELEPLCGRLSPQAKS